MLRPRIPMTRIAAEQPLGLLIPSPGDISRALVRALAARWELLWLGAVLLTVTLVQGVNMLGYPYIHDDEGTYVGQAWAVLTRGELAHYTYFYDHAPFGWFQIAGWMALAGALGSAAPPIEMGRAFMLLVQLGSTLALYRTARALSGSVAAASLAVLLFALSAYGVYWHRRVMLDNLMTFWLLVSLMLLVTGRLTLTRVWLSALAFGASVLSKETTVALLPVFTALVWVRLPPAQRWLGAAGWPTLAVSTLSLWVLMAAIKNELFPAGTPLGGSGEHASLIETALWQAARDADGGIFDRSSQFWYALGLWLRDDPVLVIGGSACAALLCLLLPWQRTWGLIGLATLLLWAFLGRGGVVNDHFLLPLLPLLALSIALTAVALARAAGWVVGLRLRSAPAVRLALGLVAVGAACVAVADSYPRFLGNGRRFPDTAGGTVNASLFWTSRQSDAQWQALAWLQRNVSRESYLVIDDALWVEHREPPDGGAGFPYAHYYFKLDRDPPIRDGVFGSNWRNVDYVVTTPQMLSDAQSAEMEIILDLLANSTGFAGFDSGGWPLEIKRVNKTQTWPAAAHPMLVRSWQSFRAAFIQDGRVADPLHLGGSTSTGQADAMLQAVYMNDPESFDRLWAWTKVNLLMPGGTFASRWNQVGGRLRIDPRSATGADTTIALALLFAARRWQEPAYQAEALPLLAAIWRDETVVLGGRRVAVAGNWARGDGMGGLWNPVVNPAQLAPYAYRIFAAADPSHPWGHLVDTGFDLLREVRAAPGAGGAAGAVPDLLLLDRGRRVLGPATGVDPEAGRFSMRASRLVWGLSLDWLWFADSRAKEALTALSLPRGQLEQAGLLLPSYRLDGAAEIDERGVADDALWMYASGLGSTLITGDQGAAQRAFAEKVLRRYREDGGGATWGIASSLLDQTWGWYATALMDGGLANLWADERVIDWDRALVRPSE